MGTYKISVWDKVAPNFGKIGPTYWNYFGNKLVELSDINKGARVLDIGMGRGASLFPASQKAGMEGYAIGIDNSEVMVRETSKDIINKNLTNCEVKLMNAEALIFDNDYFDNVICGFGIGYLLYGKSKLNEVFRVLKKNGQAAFSIWGVQEDQKWLNELVNNYLDPQPINEKKEKSSMPSFDNVEGIVKILKDSGFINIKTYEEEYVVKYKNKEEWWQEMWTNAVRGIFERIDELGSDKLVEFKGEVFLRLNSFYNNGVYRFRMPVIYAFGEK